MTLESWNDYLHAAQTLHAQIRNDKEMTVKVTKSDRTFGIIRGEEIGVGHLLVVLIYTDDTDFSKAFGRAYRHLKDAIKCCDNFYWFSRFLFEAVFFFGDRFSGNRFKAKPLYHALASHLVFDRFAPTIHCPTPTSDSLETTKKNVNKQGLLLQYIPKYIGDIDETKCVSTSQWSGYPDNEWFVYICHPFAAR